jgi:Prokaryotic cytochrome b561
LCRTVEVNAKVIRWAQSNLASDQKYVDYAKHGPKPQEPVPPRVVPPCQGCDARSVALPEFGIIPSAIDNRLSELVIWTGLAMSPAIASAFPAVVTVFGGQQSARTIHFFVSVFLVLFLLVHIVMVCLAGFRDRMRAMITGAAAEHKEHA